MPPCESCGSENVIQNKTWGPKLRCVDCGHTFIDWFYDDYSDDPESEFLEMSVQSNE